MKSGTSWGIRNIDDRTREMAEAAARRAGMTLEAWVSQAVAERAGEEGILAARDLDDEDAGGIAAWLARLGELGGAGASAGLLNQAIELPLSELEAGDNRIELRSAHTWTGTYRVTATGADLVLDAP